MNITALNTYGIDFKINRAGYVELHRRGRMYQLGETRSRIFLSAVVLASLVEIEDADKAHRMARFLDRLADLVTGDLRGATMRRVFDTLHVLKLEAGDEDVSPSEIADRLLLAA